MLNIDYQEKWGECAGADSVVRKWDREDDSKNAMGGDV
jgi:hypothetical protein